MFLYNTRVVTHSNPAKPLDAGILFPRLVGLIDGYQVMRLVELKWDPSHRSMIEPEAGLPFQ